MGSTSPQIKSFISMAYEYHLKKTEKNLVQLQRQLQILSVVSDLSIFEPTNMGTLEFFVCLQQLLSESDSRSPLAAKVINLLSHLSRSTTIRAAMRDEMHLIPVISQFLLSSKLNNDKSQKTLQLLQELSYGVKIRHIEGWLFRIIPYLASRILESDSLDDGVEQAVSTLANLCRQNPPVVTLLKDYSERKLLLRTLINLKGPSSLRIQLLVSEIMIYVNMDHSKLDSEQIMNTLYLLFMVAMDGLSDQNETSLLLAKDVFEEMLQKPELVESIKIYNNFGSTTQTIIGYVTAEVNPVCLDACFHLLALVVQLQHKDLISLHNQLFSIVLPLLPNSRCSPGPQKLLHALISVANDSVASSHVQECISFLREGLCSKDELALNQKTLKWLCSVLNLLESFCERDTSFLFQASKAFAPPTLSGLLLPLIQINNSHHEEAVDFSQLSRNTLSSSYDRSSSFDPDQKLSRISLEERCSEGVVRILTMAKLLGTHNPEFKVEFREMLGNEKVMEHLVRCERSSDAFLVSKATSILCNESIPNENLDALIKAQTEANLQSNGMSGCEDEWKGDVAFATSHSQEFLLSRKEEDTVDSLISKLNGSVEKAELKDIPLTQVMELYEYKLAALAHNEKTLKEALASSDALNREVKLSLMQSKAESARVRSLLRVWEDRLQQSLREKQDRENQISQIKDSARKLRSDLTKEKTALERDLVAVKSDLTKMNRAIEAKEEETRRLHRQISEAAAENKAMQKVVRQEQDERRKLLDVISKMEEEKKKQKKDFEEFEKEYARLEKTHSALKKENGELEMLIRSHEETLAEKEAQIEVISKENSSLKKIQDMIHNISSGKV